MTVTRKREPNYFHGSMPPMRYEPADPLRPDASCVPSTPAGALLAFLRSMICHSFHPSAPGGSGHARGERARGAHLMKCDEDAAGVIVGMDVDVARLRPLRGPAGDTRAGDGDVADVAICPPRLPATRLLAPVAATANPVMSGQRCDSHRSALAVDESSHPTAMIKMPCPRRSQQCACHRIVVETRPRDKRGRQQLNNGMARCEMGRVWDRQARAA